MTGPNLQKCCRMLERIAINGDIGARWINTGSRNALANSN